jgi:hypothetical protein
MPFRFSDEHIRQFYSMGYTVFRGILPPSLISDLRREADRARDIARKKQGPQTQRLQPVAEYDLDHKVFEAYRTLPPLVDAISRLLTPQHKHHTRQLGILFEPAERPWCTPWHRDITEKSPQMDVATLRARLNDWHWLNQCNVALYDDPSTWFVPGSCTRLFDTEGETRASIFPELLRDAERGQATAPAAEIERVAIDYCQAMPGAVQLVLNAGDYAIYRPVGWHIGNYTPYRKRATLHDHVVHPEYAAFLDDWAARLAKPAVPNVA